MPKSNFFFSFLFISKSSLGTSLVIFMHLLITPFMSKINIDAITDENLFGPCGMFCGFCGSYLAKKYNVPRRRGIISYCEGCRPRNKQCSFLKKRCALLLNNEVEYCNECPDYPCNNLEKINTKYKSQFHFEYNFLETLKVIQKEGPPKVISELKKKHRCEKCGEILCIHNGLCYNCDQKTLATMKNYRNDIWS